MNMTYHAFGDNEKRAAALAHLQHNYEQAGWQRITGELPDYLPLMLEFLSICPDPKHTAPVWQCLRGMQPLVERLEKKEPIYACLVATDRQLGSRTLRISRQLRSSRKKQMSSP